MPESRNKGKSNFGSNKSGVKKRAFYKRNKPGFKKLTEQEESVKTDESVRLNKFIANAGICSRREADVIIQSGIITINGKIITELGTRVYPNDVVKYGKQTINNQKPIYVVINKPKNLATTATDTSSRKTIFELVPDSAKKTALTAVGKLENEASGVMLLTNDMELIQKLINPKHGIKKTYHITASQKIEKEDIKKLEQGVDTEVGFIKAESVSYLRDDDKFNLSIEIYSGKNLAIKRMFEALNISVSKIDRISFASLTKKNLLRGQSRFLTEKEVGFLKMLS